MKKNSVLIVLLFSFILSTSCTDPKVKMLTTVNEDGTCIREVSYQTKADKRKDNSTDRVSDIPTCLALDEMKMHHTITKNDSIIKIYHQAFTSPDKMGAHSPLRLHGKRLQSVTHLEKKFRWFYTEYTFTETFACLKKQFPVKASTITGKDTVSYWFTGSPNITEGLSGAETADKINEIEPKITEWLNRNLIATVYNFITKNYDGIPNPPISKEKFIAQSDSFCLFMIMQIKNSEESTNIGKYDIIANSSNVMKSGFKQFFHTNAYNIFFDDNNTYGKLLNKKIENYFETFMLKIDYVLCMPGKVTHTGQGRLTEQLIEKGFISYPLTGERLIPHDYTLTATSRVTHLWAYAISILIIAGAIVLFFYKR